jgi:hypothetical protein
MYKARFAQWKLKKNLTAQDVPELLNQMSKEPSKDPTALVVRGRRVPSERAKQYLKRNAPIALLVDYKSTSYRKAPAPPTPPAPRIPKLMSLPNDLRLPYEVVQLSRQYVAGCGDGTYPVFYPTMDAAIWLNDIWAAGSLVKRRRFKQAFKILDIAFVRLKELIRNPEPSLFILVYYILFQLPGDIAQRLCTYAAEMSSILLPAKHPMTLIWSRISRTDGRQRLDYAWTILNSYFQSLKQEFQFDEYRVLNFSRVFYILGFKLGLVDLDTVQAKVQDVITGLERLGERQDVLKTRISLGDVLLQSGKNEAAEKIINEAKKEIYQKVAKLDRFILLNYYCLAFNVHKTLGKTEGIIELGRKLVRAAVSEFGFTSGTMLDCAHEVHSYWAEIGRVDEANELLRVLSAGDELEQRLRAYIRDMDTTDGEDRVCEILDS